MEASGDGLLITGGFFQLESTQSTLLICPVTMVIVINIVIGGFIREDLNEWLV